MNEYIPHGAIEDPRPEDEMVKDHLHEELFGGLPVVWAEKPKETWRVMAQRNQDGSFSCFMQSAAFAVENFLKEVYSAIPYQLRAGGKGSEGMYAQNVGDIVYNTGISLESISPSQNMNDFQIDSAILPVMTVKVTGYRTFSSLSIDKVAEAIQAYGNCILVFNSNNGEWQITPFYMGNTTTFGHAICATDFTLIGGVKTLVANDSAGQFSSPTGLRLITEDFFNKRCKGGIYFLGVKKIDNNLSPSLSISVWQQFVSLLRSIGVLTGNIIKGIIT